MCQKRNFCDLYVLFKISSFVKCTNFINLGQVLCETSVRKPNVEEAQKVGGENIRMSNLGTDGLNVY